MQKNPGQIMTEIYEKHKGEKVVGVFNFMRPALMIRDPALITHMLTTEFHKFADNDFDISEKVDRVFSKNIFVQKGEIWKRNRQALSPAFTVGRVKSTYEKIQDVAEKLVKYLGTNSEPDVKATMSLYTSEIVASWGIGIDGNSFDDPNAMLPKLGKMIFQPGFSTGLGFTILAFSPKLAELLKLKLIPDEVPDFFDGVLREIIRVRSETDGQYKDYLQYFVELKKKRLISKNEDQHHITDDDIVSGLISFFIEGYETSSAVLSLLLYHLVKNPSVQKQLREEVDELYKKENGKPSFEGLVDLPYLGKVYSETVRLHGALTLPKRCTEACTLDLGNGKSIDIEKGTGIVIPLLGLHNDPEYWPNPEKFDPDRFGDDKVHPKGTYIPFGLGPRICIGMRIASAMIKTAAVYVVRNYDLLPTKKTAPKFVQDPKHFLSAMQGGVHFKFSKRNLN